VTDSTRKKLSETTKNYWKSNIDNHPMKKHNILEKFKGCNNPNYGKTKYKILSPEGEVFIIDGGITNWCKSRGLNNSTLRQVAQGKYKHHKGWTAKII
jgi:hypothetical protein